MTQSRPLSYTGLYPQTSRTLDRISEQQYNHQGFLVWHASLACEQREVTARMQSRGVCVCVCVCVCMRAIFVATCTTVCAGVVASTGEGGGAHRPLANSVQNWTYSPGSVYVTCPPPNPTEPKQTTGYEPFELDEASPAPHQTPRASTSPNPQHERYRGGRPSDKEGGGVDCQRKRRGVEEERGEGGATGMMWKTSGWCLALCLDVFCWWLDGG